MLIKAQLINCQNIKNATFTFATDKINIIAADNGTGKSILFKMLKITACPKYFSRDERKELIRHGEDCAKIFYQFEDGSQGCTQVFKTYTMYAYKRVDEDAMETSYDPIPEMVAQVGLISDSKTDFVANIVDADQDLLLVNSRLKDNYNLVRMLTEHDQLENTKERIQDASLKTMNLMSSLITRRDMLNTAIEKSTYFDVVAAEQELVRVEKAKDLIFQVIEIANDILAIKETYTNQLDFETVQKCLDFVELVEQADLTELTVLQEPADLTEQLNLLEILQDVDLHELVVMQEPVNIEDELALLENLENVQVSDVLLSRPPANVSRELLLLESLDKLNVQELFVGTEPECLDEYLDLLEQIIAISQALILFSSVLLTLNTAKEEYERVELELNNSGDKVNCPIYGEVIYYGKECIPCGE